jgi:predicted phage terminase large subunit-like protein
MTFRSPIEEQLARAVVANPKAAAQAFVKQRAEQRLIDFVRLCWKVTDPGQPLRVGWAMEAICEHLEAVSNGHIRNLLINVPPGFSKSLCTGVFWPAWEWGPKNRSDLRILSWSYAEHLTKRDNDRTRTLLNHPLYRALWGDRVTLKTDQNEKKYFKTQREGWKMASTIKGVGTGERADRLILDDPHSVDGADSDADREGTISWFGGTMPTRVRNSNPYSEMIDGVLVQPSATVIIMQRVHRRDVSGVVLDQGLDFHHLLIEMEYEGTSHPARRTVGYRPSPIGWVDPREALIKEVDRVTADVASTRSTLSTFRTEEMTTWTGFVDTWALIGRDIARLADPVRFSRPSVQEVKQRMLLKQGTNAVAAQLRQWPHEGEGALFKRAFFQFVDPQDVPPGGRDECRGWDLAASDTATADATSAVKLRMTNDGRIYVMDVKLARLTPGGVDDLIKSTAKADGFGVVQSFPQDPGSAGKHLISHISRQLLHGHKFRSSPEMKDKARRAEPFAAQAEHGNVYLVRAPWNESYISELVEFPFGLNDDQVDATSRAYDALLQTAEIGEMIAPKLFTAR